MPRLPEPPHILHEGSVVSALVLQKGVGEGLERPGVSLEHFEVVEVGEDGVAWVPSHVHYLECL